MDFADGCLLLATEVVRGGDIKKTLQTQNHRLVHLNLFL